MKKLREWMRENPSKSNPHWRKGVTESKTTKAKKRKAMKRYWQYRNTTFDE